MFFWNIFLLIIPFLLFYYLEEYYKKNKFKKKRQKLAAFFIFLSWLIFVPNAAYIITDMRHISFYCPFDLQLNICANNAWMIMFFFIYSIIGWIGFVYLIGNMKNFISKISNKKYARLFIITIIPSVSLGVLMGLLNRWNSWDILIYPLEIIKTSFLYFSEYYYFRDWVVFTVGFYLLYFAGEKLFKNIN